ncbi:MAG: hypothetical protein AABY13_06025 [Nanoarchaeota archaeon]
MRLSVIAAVVLAVLLVIAVVQAVQINTIKEKVRSGEFAAPTPSAAPSAPLAAAPAAPVGAGCGV